MKHHHLFISNRIISVLIILAVLISLFSPVLPARADDRFLSPDSDNDGIPNQLETNGWFNMVGGEWKTDPNNADSDNDGLTDGEEKLFNTRPLDSHSPGIAVRYNTSFKTRQYFSVTDPAYLAWNQGGDQYLMNTAVVVRRGTTFTITGPASGTLAIAGTSMTALTPVKDPARGGWTVSIPSNGTVGTYTATVTDGTWSKSMPVYVIFELPTGLSQDQINYFLYDDDPANKKDEVSVWLSNPETSFSIPCSDPNQTPPCSNWQYHYADTFAEAFWTEQFTKKVFVNQAIQVMQGQTDPESTAYFLAQRADREYRTVYGNYQNTWTTAMNRWNDGTGITASGGGCEGNANVFTTLLRSAGIAARPFQLDYNKTAGHGESGEIGLGGQYDHSAMMWVGSTWKALRSYNGEEGKYYPWVSGTTGIALLKNWGGYTGYYTDYYADNIQTIGAGWDFQTSQGIGTVNTSWATWGPPSSEFVWQNRDSYWRSESPLQITQSPYMENLSCQLWKGDGWAPSEWSGTSSPAGRNAVKTYFLPSGIPNPANPMENWPYTPQPIACSYATPTALCNAYKAAWTAVCPAIPGQGQQSIIQTHNIYLPFLTGHSVNQAPEVQLGAITSDHGSDLDGDGRFDQLTVEFNVTSSMAGEYQFGGSLQVGENTFRSSDAQITLEPGEQTVQITFDGQHIGDSALNGPYQVAALWAAKPDQSLILIDPEKVLDYQKYTYSTQAYTTNQFMIQPAVFADGYTHQGVDADGNGLYDSVQVNVLLTINIPGSYTVEGDLYDGQGNFVNHASWTGNDANGVLQFGVTNSQPPYSLEHLYLFQTNGALIDNRYVTDYQITDLGGLVEPGEILIGSGSGYGTENVNPDPSSYTFTPVDTNGNGKYDKLVVSVIVNVTDEGTFRAGNYRIEAMLEDEFGTLVAYNVTSLPGQALVIGQNTMTLEFDGKMLYDQLPLAGSRAFKLVAVRIFTGYLSPTTLASHVYFAATSPAYARSAFEPSSLVPNLFQDDLEGGTGKWTSTSPWSLVDSTWHSGSHAWMASATTSTSGQLSLASPLDFTNYAQPAIRFTNAYRMASANDKGILEVSTNGGISWTPLATYTNATTAHWNTEIIDLSAYGKLPDVRLRFNAQASSGLLWYVDDVYINAWPAVKTASFTYPPQVVAGASTTLTASYTSIDMTIPVTYKWNFCTVQRQTTTPAIIYQFPNAGDCAVTLIVQSPYDSATTTQTINVTPGAGQYTLTVIANPTTGGSLSKSPNKPAYNPSEVVSVTATQAEGYIFSNWSGACTGNGACVVTMDDNKSVTAVFTPIEYSLTINITGNGLVTKSPDIATYHYGDVVQLTAVHDQDWSFSHWSGDLEGLANPASITINGNKNVTATFLESAYHLNIGIEGNGSVTKNPDQASYPLGQVVAVTANAAPGWTFVNWSGDLTSFANPNSITMDSDKSVTAGFTQDHYTLDVNVIGSGTVAKSPDQATYTYGTLVTLTPSAVPGWSFSAWGGACSGSGACVVTMSGNKTVTATFTQDQYTLSVGVTGSGTVAKVPNQATYTYGMVVSLTPSAAQGWSLSEWGGDCSGIGACVITMNGNKSVTATFIQNVYTLAISIIGTGEVQRNIQGPYHYGDIVQLTAQITSGWSFESWSGDLSGNTNPASISIDGNKSVTANFTQDWYYLTVLIDGGGHVNVDPPGPYRWHGMPILTAYPDPGWTFTNWTGESNGTDNPIAVSMKHDSSMTAHFTAIPYTFTSSVVGQGTVSKSPEKTTYTYGDQVTVTASPASGWSFDHWTGSCSGNGTCVVTVDENESVTATFVAGANTLNVSVVGSGTVTKAPDQPTYPNGANVILTATVDPGWVFTGWTGDVTSVVNPLTITMDNNKAVTATFMPNTMVACDVPALVDAITVANSDGEPDVLGLATDCTYSLSAAAAADPDGYGPVGLPPISTDITIIGYNATLIRTGASPFRLFYVTPTGSLSLENISLSNGLAQGGNGGHAYYDAGAGGGGMGGAIYNRGVLTLNNVNLTGNTALGGNGGNDNVIANTLVGGGGGGGMGGNGQSPINTPSNIGGRGGGLNGGTGGDCTVGPQNGGIGGGGGGQSSGCYTGIGGPGGFGGGGGGNTNGGAGGFGGGGAGGQVGYGGTAGLGGFGGGAGGTWTGGGGAGFGGAIFNDIDGNLTVNNSILSGNIAQGGNGTEGTDLTLGSGAGGSGYGGAIFNHGGIISTDNITLSNNVVLAGTSFAGRNAPGLAVEPNIYIYNGPMFTLEVTSGANGTVTITPNQTKYDQGATVKLTAVPDTEYSLAGWSGDLTGTTNPAYLTITGNKSVTAAFSNQYTLTVNSAHGPVTKLPDQATYIYGTNVVLTMGTVEAGWTFTGWSGGGCSGTGSCTVTMNANTTVTATFAINTYTITASASANGSITPSGAVSVNYGADQSFTIAATTTGYRVADVLVDGVSVGAVTSYTFTDVQAAHTIAASFEIIPQVEYTITASAGANGSITPSGAVIVTEGANQSFTIAATTTGYRVADVLVDGVSVGAVTSYTFTDVQAAHTIAASFEINTYTITASAGANGSITPSGAVSVNYGADQSFTIAATTTGYRVADVLVDGVSVGAVTSYTFTDVQAAHTIAASFEIIPQVEYTITASAGANGSITPSGAVIVTEGANQSFTIAATTTGYRVADVLVDGVSVGAVTSYTFTDVQAAHTIAASFEINTYTITASAGANGSITPSGAVSVNYDADQSFTIAATTTGYRVADVLVDGVSVGAVTSYTFTDVQAAHTIAASFAADTFTLSYTAGTGGTLSGTTPQTVAYGGSGTEVTAVPNTGYHFVSWSDGILTAARTDTNVVADVSVTANFTQNEYTLTINSAYGSVSVNDPAPYHYSDSVILTMGTVDPGYTFTGWSGSGCGGTGSCTVTFSGNMEVTANFTQNAYTLDITIDPSASGTVVRLPDQPTYTYNQQVTLTPTPADGWSFSAWSGACTGGGACVVTMGDNRTVTATFTQNAYTLAITIDPSASGTVAKSPDQASYTYGQEVTLTPTSADGWTFAGWSGGGCSGTDPCTVTMNSNIEVTANFTQDEYSLDVGIDPADSGNSVTAIPGGPYHYGEVVSLTPVSVAGWRFDHMLGATCTETGCTVTITGNMVVTAYFTKIEYTLNLISSPAEGGTISPDKPTPYYYNDPVTLTPHPSAGYIFSSWDNACGTNPECVVTITGNTSVTAIFTLEPYILDVTIDGNGVVTKVPDQLTYTYGQVVNLTATADPGWSFAGWGGACSGNGDCQVTMDANKAVTANFTRDEYTLDITPVGNGTVTPDNSGPYFYGDVLILTAVPAEGWSEPEWSVAGCTGNSCTVTMYGDQSVIATFTENLIDYTLNTSVDGNGSITRNPDYPLYPHNTTVTLTANPDPGWNFNHWDGACAGKGNPCTIVMDSDKTVTAYFVYGLALPKNLISSAGTIRESFDSMTGWTVGGSGSGYGATLDTTHVMKGTASIKLTTPASGNVNITKAVSWDLSAAGNLRFWVYVSGSTEPSGGSITLFTNTSSYYTISYGAAFKFRARPGWNLINLIPSDWKSSGSPSWATITSIRIRLDSRSVNTYSFDELTSGVVAQPAVIFTFDNGLASLYSQAFSYMQTHNVHGTGYIPTDLVGGTGKITSAQLLELYNAGWTIGSQTTNTDVNLTLLSEAEQELKLKAARDALINYGILNAGYVAYPGGLYNVDTMTAMRNLNMHTGRTLLSFNNVSPLGEPYQISQRTITKTTSLATVQGWVDTAIARQEILVITIQGLSNAPGTYDWYITRFQSLVNYCINTVHIPIITMDELYQLQSGPIIIPIPK